MVSKMEIAAYRHSLELSQSPCAKTALLHATLWSAFFVVAVIIGLLS